MSEPGGGLHKINHPSRLVSEQSLSLLSDEASKSAVRSGGSTLRMWSFALTIPRRGPRGGPPGVFGGATLGTPDGPLGVPPGIHSWGTVVLHRAIYPHLGRGGIHTFLSF